MVFTGRVPTTAGRVPPPVPSRRRLLAAGAAVGVLALSGCRFGAKPAAAPPNPLEPVLAGVLDLLARYDTAIATVPDLATRLRPLREEHAVHATALAHAIGGPSASPTPAGTRSSAGSGAPGSGSPGHDGTPSTGSDGGDTDPATVVAALRAAEQAGQAAVVAACLAVPATAAALLASIAACRATHVEVLT